MKDGQGVRTRLKTLKMWEIPDTDRMQKTCDGLTDTQNNVEGAEDAAYGVDRYDAAHM